MVVELEVSHPVDPVGWRSDLFYPLLVELGLHAEVGYPLDEGAKEEPKTLVSSKRPVRDTAVDENRRNAEVCTGDNKIGPNLCFREYQQIGFEPPQEPQAEEPQVEREIENSGSSAEVFLRNLLPRFCRGRDIGCIALVQESIYERADGIDLANGYGMDPYADLSSGRRFGGQRYGWFEPWKENASFLP